MSGSCSTTTTVLPRSRSATSVPSSLALFFQAKDGIRYGHVTGVQTCALPIFGPPEGEVIGHLERNGHHLHAERLWCAEDGRQPCRNTPCLPTKDGLEGLLLLCVGAHIQEEPELEIRGLPSPEVALKAVDEHEV